MDRKEDARKKIQLGGLFVKAELDHMHPAEAYILYGMLLDCKRAMQEKPAVKERWAKMGKELLVGGAGQQLQNMQPLGRVAGVNLLEKEPKEK